MTVGHPFLNSSFVIKFDMEKQGFGEYLCSVDTNGRDYW